ncbi:E3 ubiquitin-protein ligase TRIM8-like [Saccostrea echinata]|uniref:E3 ubiquitin-protein ligase TRIM8-like n=1 Tax=Saccostrea echinata TaxID=191078 RepID=UPI002A7EFF8D|nr:E3 ubiquitin-protein ligase TRIM8-like [Saccostrea echinata]
MATALLPDTIDNIGDLTKCSICFEAFKTPRTLPCSHTFCHGCLSSYIVSSCRCKVDPVGFHCPLCREFTPPPILSGNPNEWCEYFGINQVLSEFSKQREQRKLCEACKRGKEEEEAREFCLSCNEALCENCTKYHKINRMSFDHKICDLTDIKAASDVSNFKSTTCTAHKNRPVELYCNDHDRLCCTMCVSTDHRKCDSVETVEQKAEKIRKSGAYVALYKDIGDIENKLCKTKEKQEENISLIEDATDKITTEIQNMRVKLVQHLEKLESECLDQISKYSKESKEKMSRNVESVNDKSQLMRYCMKALEKVKGLTDVELVMEFQNSQQKLEHIRNSRTVSLHGSLKSVVTAELEKIPNVLKFAKVNCDMREEREGIITKTLELKSCVEIKRKPIDIRSMVILSDRCILFTNCSSHGSLLMYSLNSTSDSLNFEHETNIGCPFDIVLWREFQYMPSGYDLNTSSLSADGYSEKSALCISAGKKCYGLAVYGDCLYVACLTSVDKLNTEGKQVKSYPTANGVRYVTVTRKGHIVYSNYLTNKVTAIYGQGNEIWTYSSPTLKRPNGLDKDSLDNIYVAGYGSNNVHVLSSGGTLIKVIEDLKNPVFFRVYEKRNICFVCNSHTSIRIYKWN